MKREERLSEHSFRVLALPSRPLCAFGERCLDAPCRWFLIALALTRTSEPGYHGSRNDRLPRTSGRACFQNRRTKRSPLSGHRSRMFSHVSGSRLSASRVALGLVLCIFRPVLFEGRQLAFRDSAYYYYPLYLRVQQEWHAGRIPLWDPGQNAGMPLLGNPTAAVLYPGKILHAVLPYPWAVRLYTIAHVLVAFAGMVALGRTLGLSWVGANLAGLGYGFGVRSSSSTATSSTWWEPPGFPGACAIDWLLRQGKGRGGLELSAVLALQVLGGDPEAAYLTGLCGVLYAVMLAMRTQIAATHACEVITSAVTRMLLGRPGSGHRLAEACIGFAAWPAIRERGALVGVRPGSCVVAGSPARSGRIDADARAIDRMRYPRRASRLCPAHPHTGARLTEPTSGWNQ